jgi:hypothetical protein
MTILRHYVRFANEHAEHQRAQARDIEQATTYRHSDPERERFSDVFAHLVTVWKAEERWATALLADEAGS